MQNTPMIVPSYQMAMRGMNAIREYFKTDEPEPDKPEINKKEEKKEEIKDLEQS